MKLFYVYLVLLGFIVIVGIKADILDKQSEQNFGSGTGATKDLYTINKINIIQNIVEDYQYIVWNYSFTYNNVKYQSDSFDQIDLDKNLTVELNKLAHLKARYIIKNLAKSTNTGSVGEKPIINSTGNMSVTTTTQRTTTTKRPTTTTLNSGGTG